MADLILRSWPFIRFVGALKRMECVESSRSFRSMSTLLPSFLPRSPITSCGVAVPAPRERLLNPLCRVTGTSMYFSSDCETESTMRYKPPHVPSQSGGKTRKELSGRDPAALSIHRRRKVDGALPPSRLCSHIHQRRMENRLLCERL